MTTKTRMKQVSHNEYYEFPDVDKKAYHEYIARKITREKTTKPLMMLLDQMMAIVKKNVKHYESDFYVHDFNSLTSGESNRFIWSVYDSGTRLVRMELDFKMGATSSWDYFQMLRKHYFPNDKTTYLIDLSKMRLTKIDPAVIQKEHFVSKYGSAEDYFDKQMKKSGLESDIIVYLTKKRTFENLYQEYRNHPPKELIDELIIAK